MQLTAASLTRRKLSAGQNRKQLTKLSLFRRKRLYWYHENHGSAQCHQGSRLAFLGV
jgi:hypothetical protein